MPLGSTTLRTAGERSLNSVKLIFSIVEKSMGPILELKSWNLLGGESEPQPLGRQSSKVKTGHREGINAIKLNRKYLTRHFNNELH